MEFLWVLYSDEHEKIEYASRIKLLPQSKGRMVKFGAVPVKQGSWYYLDTDHIMLIELLGSVGHKHLPLRRHALELHDDGCYELLANSHSIYDDGRLWSPGSITHNNKGSIVMQPARFPKKISVSKEADDIRDETINTSSEDAS